jgi:uncharacterized protein
MDNSLLLQSINQWRLAYGRYRASLIPRGGNARLSPERALAFTGVRRCGKTFFALEASLSRSDQEVFYYNFEDPLFFRETGLENLSLLLRLAQEHHPTPFSLLILDEIQNIEGWERWVRTLIDQKRYDIIVTGSSATLLSSELATSLTGRALEFHVWPLSYDEVLRFKKKVPTSHLEHLSAFRFYLRWGGFPHVVLLSDEFEKRDTLDQYLSDILLKDVVQRNEIRDVRSLSRLATYLFTNLSSLHSYTALRKAFGLSADLVASYLQALSSAFLIFEVERYHKNLKVQARDARKIYVVDTGMRNVVARSTEEDIGKLLENVVYLELRRRGHSVMYYKGIKEVDFITIRGYKPELALQVCAEGLHVPKTRERELSALAECLAALNLKEGVIITISDEENITLKDGRTVRVLPAYKWMLEGR